MLCIVGRASAKWQSVSQSGDRESGVGGSVASHNSFVSNSDSLAGGISDMKYQKCKIYIVITVINRTPNKCIVQVHVHNNYYIMSMQL